MAKAYAEARKQHGDSPLLDEIARHQARASTATPLPLARGAERARPAGTLRDAVELLAA